MTLPKHSRAKQRSCHVFLAAWDWGHDVVPGNVCSQLSVWKDHATIEHPSLTPLCTTVTSRSLNGKLLVSETMIVIRNPNIQLSPLVFKSTRCMICDHLPNMNLLSVICLVLPLATLLASAAPMIDTQLVKKDVLTRLLASPGYTVAANLPQAL
jgi:hypothetical protein